MMKKNICLILLVIVSCKVNKKNESPVEKEDYLVKGYSFAMVKDSRGLDGCTFLLELKDGKKLEPVNLNDSLKKSDLQIWIKYKTVQMMSVCMAGETVSIIDVKAVK